MLFSAVVAMCVAPLVLASSLQADLVARGAIDLEVRTESKEASKPAPPKESVKEAGKGSSGSGNNVVVVNQEVTQVVNIVQSTTNEIVIIWVNNGGGAATSTVTETKTVTAGSGTGANVAAATHTVVVGGAGGLVFTPESVVAAVGDMVVFTFMSQNHTVTQSAFDTPCKKLAEGMDSGFMPNANNTISPAPQMAMQVTVATPIWFYCRQKAHCGKGMTFSINPTAAKTAAMFKSMAIAQNGTGTVSPIAGGSAAPAAPAAPSAAPPAPAPSAAAPPPPANPVAAAPPAGASVAAGTGTVQAGGACACSCLCGVAAFPNAAVQGINSFGGMSGAMPMAMLEV